MPRGTKCGPCPTDDPDVDMVVVVVAMAGVTGSYYMLTLLLAVTSTNVMIPSHSSGKHSIQILQSSDSF